MRFNVFATFDEILANQGRIFGALTDLKTQGVKLMTALDDGVAALSADISALSTDFTAAGVVV